MKILMLGKIPDNIIQSRKFSFVESPEEADFVILSNEIKSYFLGSKLGELMEESYALEFRYGKPRVLFASESGFIFTPPLTPLVKK